MPEALALSLPLTGSDESLAAAIPLVRNRTEQQRRTVSLRLASAMATMSGVEFSIIIPTIYNYIRQDVAKDTTLSAVTVLNLSLTLFSVSSIFVKPLVGWAVDRFAFRSIFRWLCLLGALGGAGYALAGSSGGVPLLFFARIVGGMALGCSVAAQSYAVYTLPLEERGPYLAVLSTASFIGVFMGPMVTPLFGSVSGKLGPVIFNTYTMPGWFLFLTFLIFMGLLSWLLVEPKRPTKLVNARTPPICPLCPRAPVSSPLAPFLSSSLTNRPP